MDRHLLRTKSELIIIETGYNTVQALLQSIPQRNNLHQIILDNILIGKRLLQDIRILREALGIDTTP